MGPKAGGGWTEVISGGGKRSGRLWWKKTINIAAEGTATDLRRRSSAGAPVKGVERKKFYRQEDLGEKLGRRNDKITKCWKSPGEKKLASEWNFTRSHRKTKSSPSHLMRRVGSLLGKKS